MRLFVILMALGIWGPFCAMIAAAGIWVVKVCFMDFGAYLLLIFDRFSIMRVEGIANIC